LAVKWVREKIVRVSIDSEYFVIISDEATDGSTHECKVCRMYWW
jgi:hypothetical protein